MTTKIIQIVCTKMIKKIEEIIFTCLTMPLFRAIEFAAGALIIYTQKKQWNGIYLYIYLTIF